MKNIESLTIDTLRFLSIDSVQKSNSGHAGLPLSSAPMLNILWSEFMKYNPKNPNWADRDRFVLSASHASALMYSLMHIYGYDITIDDLKNYREIDSKTPGNPQYGDTPGVESSSGPLGQAISSAVGMAMGETYLANVFNKEGFDIVNHYTYAYCDIGCLLEGVTAEASSLAGTLGLGKLIVLYDANNFTIEGDISIAVREDVGARYKSYGWQVLKVEDGNDINAIREAIDTGKKELTKPTLIEIKTIVGYGAPNKQGKEGTLLHPLGGEEVKLTKENLGWEYEELFYVPAEVKEYSEEIQKKLAQSEQEWNELLNKYKELYPDEYKSWNEWNENKIDEDIFNNKIAWECNETLSTIDASHKILNEISEYVPNLIGGSADVGPATKAYMSNRKDFTPDDKSGSNLHFGVREHGMGAISNGIALHGGLRTYNAGFFVFCDYMHPSMRFSAFMNIPVINILTHTGFDLGKSGPSHQPIEYLASLRSIPNYTVMRPCNYSETVASWYLALTRQGPSGIVLSNQELPPISKSDVGVLKGGYILKDCDGVADIILISTGSEMHLVHKASEELTDKGYNVRVVSMFSMEIFEEQSKEYKEKVLPLNVTKRVAVEIGVEFGWHKYVGLEGKTICMNEFGTSGPIDALNERYGFTAENIVNISLELLK